MKKYILFFTLLFGFLGITSLQAKVSWKRAWQCRSFGVTRRIFQKGLSESTKQRLLKNNCTENEKMAGSILFGTIEGGAIALAGIAATLASNMVLGKYADAAVEKQLVKIYGINWRDNCVKIEKDQSVDIHYRNYCSQYLQKMFEAIEKEKERLRKGGEWSGTNPLSRKN